MVGSPGEPAQSAWLAGTAPPTLVSVSGLAAHDLPDGARLRIGAASLELIAGDPGPGAVTLSIQGAPGSPTRRAAVVTPGTIRVGEPVAIDALPLPLEDSLDLHSFRPEETADVAPSHLVSVDPAEFPAGVAGEDLAGRAMLVRRAEMLPIECVVRGYLAGSGWKEYARAGTLHGLELPAGLQESDRLPEPLFTPSTKATEGHDENISFAAAVDLVGAEAAQAARAISLAVYVRGAARAAEQGIIIADTKLELGYIDGRLAIRDEVLTPDSSRFWPADEWKPGISPPSFDKRRCPPRS